MAWIDQINSDIVIQTGDGKQYFPLYMNSTITTDFNIAQFNFPNIKGTLVKRSEPMGRKYSLEIIFQGDDHLDTAESFRKSADDKRYWQVAHPMYGTIFCHPSSLTFDSTGLNTTRITGEILETIITDAPRVTIEPLAKILIEVESVNERSVPRWAYTEVWPKNVSTATESTKSTYKKGSSKVKNGVESNEYFNLYNTALAAIVGATVAPSNAISAIKSMLMYPSEFSESAQFRINLFVDQINSLLADVSGLSDMVDKMLFENDSTTLVLGMVQSAVTPLNETDYGNIEDVLFVISQITTTYNSVVEALDSIQSENGADTDSYVADYETLTGLESVVNYAVSQLMFIALNAQQERTYICETDTNIISLAHRFYGITEDQSSIDELIRNNNIGLNETLQIRKNRVIKYYV